MIRSNKSKLISAILTGTIILGTFSAPATVMACEYDESVYGYTYRDEYGDVVYCDGWDDYVSDCIAYAREENRHVNVTGICVSSTAVQLKVGECYKITGYVKPDNASNQGITYYSTNPAIAKVNANGVITAVNPGTCNIVSVSNEGGYEVNTCMTVLPAAKTAKAKK